MPPNNPSFLLRARMGVLPHVRRALGDPRTRVAARVVTLLVVLGLSWSAVARLDGARLRQALATASFPLIALGLATQLAVVFVRAERWREMLGTPISRVKLNVYLFAAFGLSQVLPAGTTESLRVYLLRKRHAVPVPLGAASVVLEKLFEGAGLVPLVAPLPLLLDLPRYVNVVILALSGGGALVTLAMVVAARASRGSSWRVFRSRQWRQVEPGLRCLTEPRVLASVLASSVAAHVLDCAGAYLFLLATGIHVPFATTALLNVTFSLAVVLPLVPGHVGVFEAAAVAALTLVGVSVEWALAYAIVVHAAQLVLVACALPGLALLREAQAARPAE